MLVMAIIIIYNAPEIIKVV